MASAAQVGQKSLIGFVSTLSWVVLLASFLATVGLMSVDNLKHVGNSASAIVDHLSKNQKDIDSLVDEFKKNADPKTVAQIDKNRAKIEATIASIGGSKEFQDSLASILNKIAAAILNGDSSVQIDFSKLARLAADEVNKASDSVVITKKELAKLKPTTLKLGKQSKTLADVRDRIREVALAWLLWLILVGVLYLLKGWRVLRTTGWQLFSVGGIFLLVRYAIPFVTDHVLTSSTIPVYQRDLVPQIIDALTRYLLLASMIACALGLVLVFLDISLRKRVQPRVGQISPSVVA